jgi:hypothetical protein
VSADRKGRESGFPFTIECLGHVSGHVALPRGAQLITCLAGRTLDLNLESRQSHHTTAKERGGWKVESRQGDERKEEGMYVSKQRIHKNTNAATLMRPTLAPRAKV